MDEDLLSPRLGRLIDQAKAAARQAGPEISRAEGVALLTDAGTVHVGCADGQPEPAAPAAEAALAVARQAGCSAIVAAAVAVPDDPSETVMPSDASRRVLAAVDPELPIVFKQRGRWVMLSLSVLASPE